MIGSISVFVVVLFVVVLVHEMGHFLMAKWFRIKVEEFGIGLPPRLVTLFKSQETVYSLNLLPIGGFVRLYGEELKGKIKDKARAFVCKPWWVKVAVLVAGVLANFLLASVLFGVYYFFKGIPVVSDQDVTISYVVPDSPAEKSGLKEGDKIELIFDDNNNVIIPKQVEEVVKFVAKRPWQRVHFKIRRVYGYHKSEVKEIVVVPVERKGEGKVGIMISPLEIKFYPWYKQIPIGIWYGFKDSIGWVMLIGDNLKLMVKKAVMERKVPEGVTGPVGIYQVTTKVAGTGWLNIMRFIGILSVNLAVINLLPLPALDGGRVVFAMLSTVISSRKVREIEYWVHLVGMAVLILLMILITFNDVVKLDR